MEKDHFVFPLHFYSVYAPGQLDGGLSTLKLGHSNSGDPWVSYQSLETLS